MDIIIVSPSLDLSKNVSGISSVSRFIMETNSAVAYTHFELGRHDGDTSGILGRARDLHIRLADWKQLLSQKRDSLIHYNMPLDTKAVIRDSVFLFFARKHKVLLHIHGGLFMTGDVPFFFRYIIKSIFKWHPNVVVLGQREEERLFDQYGIHSTVLPNCVDLKSASESRRLGNTDSPLTIGYLGRITRDKGFDELLESLTDLKSRGVRFSFRVAGSEDDSFNYLESLKSALGSSFDYCGVVGGETKNDFLKSLDVFLLPSYYEGLPMALLESMSFGAVPVVTDVGSIPMVVKDKTNGVLVHPHSSKEITEAILYIDSDRDALCRMSSESRDTIFSSFSPETYIDTVNSLYKKL